MKFLTLFCSSHEQSPEHLFLLLENIPPTGFKAVLKITARVSRVQAWLRVQQKKKRINAWLYNMSILNNSKCLYHTSSIQNCLPPASSGTVLSSLLLHSYLNYIQGASFKNLTLCWTYITGCLAWRDAKEKNACSNYLRVSMAMLWFCSPVLWYLQCLFAPSHMQDTHNMCEDPNKENSCFILPNKWMSWMLKKKKVFFPNSFQFSSSRK